MSHAGSLSVGSRSSMTAGSITFSMNRPSPRCAATAMYTSPSGITSDASGTASPPGVVAMRSPAARDACS